MGETTRKIEIQIQHRVNPSRTKQRWNYTLFVSTHQLSLSLEICIYFYFTTRRLFLSLNDPLSPFAHRKKNVFFSHPPPSRAAIAHTVSSMGRRYFISLEIPEVTPWPWQRREEEEVVEQRTCSLIEVVQCYAQVFDLIRARALINS